MKINLSLKINQLKMRKAIKIDVEAQSVYHVEIGDSYTDIYPEIGNGCSTFCIPMTFENEDSMFADDESLLRFDDIKGGFYFNDWNYPIVGNTIILGTDEDGESVDCKTTIEEIQRQINFIDVESAQRWAKQAMSTPPQIISF